MADQPNNQPNVPNGNIDVTNLPGSSNQASDFAAQVVRELLRQANGHPEYSSRATRTSQSAYSDSKWEIKSRPTYQSRGNLLDDFENGIKDQLKNALVGGDWQKSVQDALKTFSDEFGFDLRNIGHEAGKALTNKAVKAFQDSKFGQNIQKGLSDLGKDIWNNNKDKFFTKEGQEKLGRVKDSFFKTPKVGDPSGADIVNQGQSGLADQVKGTVENKVAEAAKDKVAEAAKDKVAEAAKDKVAEAAKDKVGKAGADLVAKNATKLGGDALGKVVGNVGGTLGKDVAGKVGGKILAKGAGKAAASMGPWGLLIVAIIYTIYKVLKPALEGLAKMFTALGKTFKREDEMRKKRLEAAKKRLEDDINYLTEEPFKILQEATEKWTSTWDSNLRTIGQTQGYDKESVYALYERYAKKLDEDNLTSAINATDIIDKLSSVLESGLSGEVAERFAYAATKLEAAIPGQDFFSYADAYASIAANAISQGSSQREALQAADDQLNQFASNLLYASRELAGGFSTGLKNGSELFNDAVRIAQTAKNYGAVDTISGTLTSVSAIIGAVAPDLASGLVSNVVEAALGGNNNSSLVALRSLAGINAGNTEFLRTMAEDPKSVFSTLFTNLANLQNMSSDNYMEVAEGLADVFGIDKAAFARVDFNYLASAIDAMDVNSRTLDDNLRLLASGQTTTSAEQLKAQEINRIILDEGLAYVIDSEAGRAIQEHMWQEQQTVAITEATYATEIQGAALELLEGLRKSFTTLLNFLNPAGFIAKGVKNIVASVAESVENDQDIAEILKLGAVGSNSDSFTKLTTRGKDLNLVSPLVEMMGGRRVVDDVIHLNNIGMDLISSAVGLATGTGVSSGLGGWGLDQIGGLLGYGAKSLLGMTDADSTITKHSRYSWGTVGKSTAKALHEITANTNTIGAVASSVTSSSQAAMEDVKRRVQEFLDTAPEAAKTMTFEDWMATAKDKGISDIYGVLSDFDLTVEDLKSYFEANDAMEGAKREATRQEDEQKFRDETRAFWDYESGTSGIFQSAMWFPFFGDGQKYDTRMTAVDTALSNIQSRIGMVEDHTVIGVLEEVSTKIGDASTHTVIEAIDQIQSDISTTFVSANSTFQRCLADWTRYIAASESYSTSLGKSTAWSELNTAEKGQQTEATLALANALGIFSAEELKKMDPQLQTNVLLGEILVVIQAIMQENNNQAGGLSLIDTISALGLGMTKST